eukprot:165223-Hanusia_phi.AAC.1
MLQVKVDNGHVNEEDVDEEDENYNLNLTTVRIVNNQLAKAVAVGKREFVDRSAIYMRLDGRMGIDDEEMRILRRRKLRFAAEDRLGFSSFCQMKPRLLANGTVGPQCRGKLRHSGNEVVSFWKQAAEERFNELLDPTGRPAERLSGIEFAASRDIAVGETITSEV